MNLEAQEDRRPPRRILVVDDEPAITELLVELLNGHGFEAHAVNKPLKTVERALELRPDLILMDFVMPQLLGPEVAQRLKAHPATAAIPVIFLSGMTDEDHRIIAALSGGAGYLDKPVDHEELLRTIRKALQGGS